MNIWLWLAVPLAALFLGIFLVQYLVVHPLKMARYLTATGVTLAALVVALGEFGRTDRPLALGLALAAFVAGYCLMTWRFLARDDPRPIPALTRAADDPGLGHTAVVYFTHGEPETYDPIGWINQFREFDEQRIRFVPFVARPFFAYQLRRHYLHIGRSDHRRTHLAMLRQLEQRYREAGDLTTRFYISFLDDDPRPDAAVIQALNDGAGAIVVAEVFLTISNHTAEGKHLIDELDLSGYDVPISYTGPLWDSEALRSMFVARANAHRGDTPKEKVGILLVGHGQPDEWDVEWSTETEQEIGFRQEVLKLLAQDGYRPENMGLAWMEFKKPKPAKLVEKLVSQGVERILYYSAAISADSLHSQYDVPSLVDKARVPAGLPLINLGAWGNDPLVIDAIQEKVQRLTAPATPLAAATPLAPATPLAADVFARAAQEAPAAD